MVKDAVDLTRAVHTSLAAALLQPSAADVALMHGFLESATPAALRRMSVEGLLDATGIVDKQACAAYARQLIASTQLRPARAVVAATPAAAAAAVAAAAANPGGNHADPWKHHPKFQTGDLTHGAWLDRLLLQLLGSPTFVQVVIAWADARVNRPAGAVPEDLMASAKRKRQLLGLQAPAPTLLPLTS